MIFFLVIPFLALGCAVFLVCAAIPFLRRYAFSASLWCLALMPWLFGLAFLLVVLGLARNLLGITLARHSFWQMPDWNPFASTSAGYLVITIAAIGSLATATIAARLHQFAIHRMTLALFRLYAAGVSLGVGILTSLFMTAALGATYPNLARPVFIYFLCGLILASVGLAVACYKFASQFRGSYPSRFPLVTLDEFTSA